MFELKTEYDIKRIYNGNGAKGDFAFINIEDKKASGKFADKLTVCVWGENVDAEDGDSIVINSVLSFGLKAKKNQKEEWIKELQCTCRAEDFEIIKDQIDMDGEIPPQAKLEEVDNEKLPF